MKENRSIITCLSVLIIATRICAASPVDLKPRPDALIAEGQRLVEKVGLCVDCHAAHLPDGSLDREHWLLGAPLPFKPTVPMPWAEVAPPIAGLDAFTEEQAVHFLMTGERPNNVPVRPPMPAFRLSESEAHAIVAYLKSLKTP